MIEIDDLSLNEWYACLKPYQKVVIEQLGRVFTTDYYSIFYR